MAAWLATIALTLVSPLPSHRANIAAPALKTARAAIGVQLALTPADNDGAEPKPTPLVLSVAAAIPFLGLVTVKTATDLITNHVKRPPATATALVSEMAIFPLIAIWLLVGNGMRRLKGGDNVRSIDIGAVYMNALRDRPFRLGTIGLVYALDNLLYFFAQSNVGAVTYTVLAQSKIFFTVAALRMRGMLGELKRSQQFGLLCLFSGAVLVALKDVATGVAASQGNRMLGIVGLLCAQAATATANVAYERKLREPGCDVWVRNVQLTAMISLWLAISSAVRTCVILCSGGTPPSPAYLLGAFCAPWVWLVVALKAASAVLIALTISAGGNVLYAISKPWPVVFATLTTCLVLGRVPSVGFMGGILLSIAGIGFYYYNGRQA